VLGEAREEEQERADEGDRRDVDGPEAIGEGAGRSGELRATHAAARLTARPRLGERRAGRSGYAAGMFMRRTAISSALALCASLISLTPTAAAGAPAAGASEAPDAKATPAKDPRPAFGYRVSMNNPERHEFQVELDIDGVSGRSVDLQMPRWNPGAYDLTEAHKNVRGVVAKGRDGKALPVEKVDTITWRVHHDGKPFKLSYRVYRGRYSGVTGAYLDDAMGFFNGVYLFLYVVGHKDRPIDLRVDGLPGASVTTGLPRGKAAGTLRAADYDVLVDSPVHVGKVETLRFEVAKIPFRIALHGSGDYNSKRLIADFTKIVEAAFAVFGGPPAAAPFQDYTFIVHLLPGARGGLEHLNSTVVGVDPWAFGDPATYRRFLGLVAHEFFHLWNVKRIRPAVLGPFAYDREVHTGMLWFSEGVTSYYSWLLLSRAGLASEAETLEKLAETIKKLQETPGRKLVSVEQASWETWSKPDDGVNAYVDYYTKGMLIGAILDLELRRLTAGRSSVDSVFRELFARFVENGAGIRPAEVEQIFINQAGVVGGEAIRLLFAAYVHGLEELDFNRHLAAAGYALSVKVETAEGELGVELSGRDGRAVIDRVHPEGPAFKAALAAGDVIVAIDGGAVDLEQARRAIKAMPAGSNHSISVIRHHRLIERKVTAAAGGAAKYSISSVAAPSLEQLALRSAWLGIGAAPAAPPAAGGMISQ
jgi:predicted metalloprotease with PDZ domain